MKDIFWFMCVLLGVYLFFGIVKVIYFLIIDGDYQEAISLILVIILGIVGSLMGYFDKLD